jgi:hypothetical protein
MQSEGDKQLYTRASLGSFWRPRNLLYPNKLTDADKGCWQYCIYTDLED